MCHCLPIHCRLKSEILAKEHTAKRAVMESAMMEGQVRGRACGDVKDILFQLRISRYQRVRQLH